MPQTITLTLDLGLLVTVALGVLAAFVLIKAVQMLMAHLKPGMPGLAQAIGAWLRIRFSRDPLWARSMEAAYRDGFDQDSDPFEFLAVGRDLVCDETGDLLGIEPDLTDLATICTYLRRTPEVLDIHVVARNAQHTSMMKSLALGADALVEAAVLPKSMADLVGAMPGKNETSAGFGSDFEAELEARFGVMPDLPTLAGLCLAIEEHAQIAAVRITLRPHLHRSSRLLSDLTGRDPQTGQPFISTAELSSEPAI